MRAGIDAAGGVSEVSTAAGGGVYGLCGEVLFTWLGELERSRHAGVRDFGRGLIKARLALTGVGRAADGILRLYQNAARGDNGCFASVVRCWRSSDEAGTGQPATVWAPGLPLIMRSTPDW